VHTQAVHVYWSQFRDFLSDVILGRNRRNRSQERPEIKPSSKTQKALGGWSSPGPTAEAYSAPQSSSWIPREGKKRGMERSKGWKGRGYEGGRRDGGRKRKKRRKRVQTGKQA